MVGTSRLEPHIKRVAPVRRLDMQNRSTVYYTAKDYVDAGLSVIPIAADGSKQPDAARLTNATGSPKWEPFKTQLPTDANLKVWFSTGMAGIAIIGGAISGNLERIDFDHPGAYSEWYALCEECEMGKLVSSLPLVRTPRADDCYHLYYRCEEPIEKNIVLAKVRLDDGKCKTIIETRGEAGYTLAPGSPAACHPTKREYALVRGDLTAIPVITKLQRDMLLELARSFNEEVRDSKPLRPAETATPDGVRPGDDYNNRGDFRSVLEKHGWSSWNTNGTEYWTRPGKDWGVSATFDYKGNNCFYVFSSNADPFEADNSYSPFAVYAILEHGGDYGEAAKALREQSYGEDAGTVKLVVGSRKAAQLTEDETNGIIAKVAAAKDKGTVAAAYKVAEDIAKLPDGVREDVIHDLSTSIKAVRKADLEKQVEKLRRQACKDAKRQSSRPMLVLNHRQQRDVVSDATNMLLSHNEPPYLYSREESIVRLAHTANGEVMVVPVEKDTISTRLINISDVVNETEDDFMPSTLPEWVSKYILQAEQFPFPNLNGVVYAPIMRENGSLVAEHGYDPSTGFYYQKRGGCVVSPIPERVSDEDVRQARDLLCEVVYDFPFDGEASRANTIALFMTPVLRNLYRGLPQGCLIDAPKQKSGKTLLSLVAAIIATGEEVAGTTAPVQEEEWAKKLVSQLQMGTPILIFDNVRHRLTSSSLEAALTLPVFEQRLLGTNRVIRARNSSLFIFNGNNTALSDDMATRIFVVRLNPKCADPEYRSGFLHPHLKQWVKENRGRILRAIYVLYKKWHQDGRPDCAEAVAVGSFEGWSKLIGNVLAHAGIAGFLGNRDDLKNRLGSAAGQWETFLADWYERIGGKGITTKQFVSIYQHDLEDSIPDDLAKALEPFAEHAKNTAVGKVFAAKAEARFGKAGFYLSPAGKSHGAQFWRVDVDDTSLLVNTAKPPDETESQDNQAETKVRSDGRDGFFGRHIETLHVLDLALPACDGDDWDV